MYISRWKGMLKGRYKEGAFKLCGPWRSNAATPCLVGHHARQTWDIETPQRKEQSHGCPGV